MHIWKWTSGWKRPQPKYEMLRDDTVEEGGQTLCRIRALRDFGPVRKGELGGYIAGEHNLSHRGDCWVFGNARVWDRARISGNAMVGGQATVAWRGSVSENAWVLGEVEVKDEASVAGHAVVHGRAKVAGNATVDDHARVSGRARIKGNTRVRARIADNEVIGGASSVGDDPEDRSP